MYSVIDKFAEIVATTPNPILGSAGVGPKRPSTSSDLPAIVVSVAIESVKSAGIGRVMRFGETVTKHTVIVPVAATPETFSSDLKQLRLAPLPLKRNPASLGKSLTGQDVQIRNVTDASNPTTYRFNARPTLKDEYEIDEARAVILLGTPQTAGEQLEVTHWTVTWKDDVQGTAYQGLVNVEVWASSLSEASNTSRKLQDRLNSDRGLLREKGFSVLLPSSLGPLEQMIHTPATGSNFPVWKQGLAYRFSFESEQVPESSSGIPIKQIDVDIEGHVKDSLKIP